MKNIQSQWSFLKKYKLNLAQIIILKSIYGSDDITTKKLSSILGLSQQTLRVYHLPKLEQRGFVGKSKPMATKDQRYRPMFLKPDGVQLLRKYEEVVERGEAGL